MKLYMPRDKFSLGVPMALRDRAGRTRYRISGDAYTLGKRLHVLDLAGREAIYVYQKIPSLLPRYAIEVYGKPVAEIVKDLTFIPPRYMIEGPPWEVLGNIATRDYELSCGSQVIAACRPQAEEILLDLMDHDAEKVALGVLLTIHCMLAPQESRFP